MLVEYIKIPNKSPMFDPDWAAHGYMDAAVAMLKPGTAQDAAFPGATLDVVRLDGRTPVIVIEVPGESADTVLLYGHLDKQPEISAGRMASAPGCRDRRQALRPRRR